jgi:hypothetical protein
MEAEILSVLKFDWWGDVGSALKHRDVYALWKRIVTAQTEYHDTLVQIADEKNDLWETPYTLMMRVGALDHYRERLEFFAQCAHNALEKIASCMNSSAYTVTCVDNTFVAENWHDVVAHLHAVETMGECTRVHAIIRTER